jgi:hypothetical protein
LKKEILINDVFEEIDNELIQKGIPITLRFMHALSELSKRFNVSIPLSPTKQLPGNDLGNKLSEWLNSWYKSKYGDNQKMNIDIGFLYIKIRGDLWLYRIPNFFGTCNFFINQDLSDKGEMGKTNILRMSEKMTQVYVNSLLDEELQDIFENYKVALDVAQILSCWLSSKIPLCSAIHADLKTVKAHIGNHSSDYGQARWAYMQCAEKILKSWLLQTGFTEKQLKNQKEFGHNIEKLIIAFNANYSSNINTDELESITCSASARYNQTNFNSNDIIKAQNWLFKLITNIGFKPVSV